MKKLLLTLGILLLAVNVWAQPPSGGNCTKNCPPTSWGSGTPDVTQTGGSGYFSGTLEVDGAARFDGEVKALGNLYQIHKKNTPIIVISNFETDGTVNTSPDGWVVTGGIATSYPTGTGAQDFESGVWTALGGGEDLHDSWAKATTPTVDKASDSTDESYCSGGTGECVKVIADAANDGIITTVAASIGTNQAGAGTNSGYIGAPFYASIVLACEACDESNNVEATVSTDGNNVYITPRGSSGAIVPATPTTYEASFLNQETDLVIKILIRAANGTPTFYVDDVVITNRSMLSEMHLRDKDADGLTDTQVPIGQVVARDDSTTNYAVTPYEGGSMLVLQAQDPTTEVSTLKTFSSSQNFSKHHFNIRFKVMDVSEAGNVTMTFSDGATEAVVTLNYHPNDQDWHNWSISRSEFSNDTTIAWDAITTVKLTVVAASSSLSAIVAFDAFTAIETFPFPMVTLSFDDCQGSTFTKAKAYMDTYNYKGILVCNSSTIGLSARVTSEQLNLLSKNGWDVASHTANHVSIGDVSTSQLKRIDFEAILSKRTFESHGVDKGLDVFGYPGGGTNTYTEATRNRLGKFFNIGFTASDRSLIAPLPSIDYMTLGRLNSGDTDNSDDETSGADAWGMTRTANDGYPDCDGGETDAAKTLIDDVILYNGVANLAWHGIFLFENGGGDIYECFTEVVDYINTVGVTVITGTDLINFASGTYIREDMGSSFELIFCDPTDETSCDALDENITLTANERGLIPINLSSNAVAITLPDCTDNEVPIKYRFAIQTGHATNALTFVVNGTDDIEPAISGTLKTAGDGVDLECLGDAASGGKWRKTNEQST